MHLTHCHSAFCFCNMCFNLLNLFFPILFLAFMGVFLFLACFFSNLVPSFVSAFDALPSSVVFLASVPFTVSPSILATFAFFGPVCNSFLPCELMFAFFVATVPLALFSCFRLPALLRTVFFVLSLLDLFSSGASVAAVVSGASAFSSSTTATETDV